MARYSDSFNDQFGAPVVGAKVYVYDILEDLADLTEDGGGELANPVETDEYGNFHFNAPDGLYSLETRYGGKLVYRQEGVPVGDGGFYPPIELRAGKYLAFDAFGNPVASSGTGADAGLRTDLAAATGIDLIGNARRVINVRTYGAVGGGITIDTAAINTAIAACSAGDTLYFPPGIYLVDNSDLQVHPLGGDISTRVLPDGVNVLMDGGAWVKRAAAEDQGVYFFAPGNDNILVVNIDGDEFPGTMGGVWADAQCFGIHGVGTSGVVIVNSKFKNLTFGIRSEGPSNWSVLGNRFKRLRNSAGGFFATGDGAIEDLIISNNRVLDMGDTAFACNTFSVDDLGLEGYRITGVDMIGNVVRNTQHLTQGFALDIEGGFDLGKQFGNRISNNIVIQDVSSTHGQGGVTMNQFCEDSEISGNVLISGTFERGDCGISVPGTRNVQVHNNTILGFRGNAIWAEGATSPSIRGNVIRNCGDSTDAANGPKWSAIVLSWEENSVDAVCSDNDLYWPTDYAYGGTRAAGILVNMGDLSAAVSNPTIRNNRLKNPLGYGIWLRGFTGGFDIDRGTIENNVITGDGSATVFLSNPIAAHYVTGLSVQGNRIYETKVGLDFTGSSRAEIKRNTVENVATSPTLATWLNLTGCTNTDVDDNHLATAVTTKVTDLANFLIGAGNRIRGRKGFVTENSGLSAAIATGGTIAHGCDVTPRVRWVTANVASAVAVGATVDATNITVTHNSGVATAFSWGAGL